MTTQVRIATQSDIDGLIDLSRQTIDACYRSFLGDAAVDAYLGSGAVDEYVRASIDACTVILVDGDVAGLSVGKENLIELMMIRFDLQRRGFGTHLLKHVEDDLFRAYGELTLESFAPNEPANSFYRKHGWRELKRAFDEMSGVDKIVFVKST